MNNTKDILASIQWMPPPSRLPRSGTDAGIHDCGKGDSQPPRNSTEVRAEIRIMLAYSPRKNSAKAMPEYSTWNPATISDSPSARSNGARLVSATPAMKYTTNIGNRGMKYQPSRP